MTTDPRATALTTFGYTPRQAAFLALVALHGGYFLRRQYAAFMHAQDGAVTVDLIDRLLQRHHATRATYCRDTHVYHVSARPLYDALDLGNSRNRRPAPPAAVTFKLMTLDLVLRHPEATFLATEAEKVAYFTTTCGLSSALLPARCYTSSTPGGRTTTRYFIDKAPIAVSPPSSTVTVAHLQVWSDGWGGFDAFLTLYRPLLTALRDPCVRFVTTNPALVAEVTSRWARLWAGTTSPRPQLEVSPAELQAYFQVRQRIERGEWQAFEPRDLDRHRDDLARFNSPDFDAVYRRWCTRGEAALQALTAPSPHAPSNQPRLEPELLPFRYPLFPATGGGSR